MTDFHTTHHVTARKRHHCEQCRSFIEIGTRHRRCAQVYDGDFHAYREHDECHAAWGSLNFDRDKRDLYAGEGAVFLADDDFEPDEMQWMRETHPLVAARLGWIELSASADGGSSGATPETSPAAVSNSGRE